MTLYAGKNGEILKLGDFCLTFNEQLNMSEPNLVPVIPPNAPLLMNNNGTPNNGNLNNRQAVVNQPQPITPIVPPVTTNTPSNNQNKPPSNSSRFPIASEKTTNPTSKPPRTGRSGAKK